MPVYVRYSGWYVFFWTNEGDEPIHFHISEGKPSENATKIWILKNSSFRLENNNSHVPPKPLVYQWFREKLLTRIELLCMRSD